MTFATERGGKDIGVLVSVVETSLSSPSYSSLDFGTYIHSSDPDPGSLASQSLQEASEADEEKFVVKEEEERLAKEAIISTLLSSVDDDNETATLPLKVLDVEFQLDKKKMVVFYSASEDCADEDSAEAAVATLRIRLATHFKTRAQLVLSKEEKNNSKKNNSSNNKKNHKDEDEDVLLPPLDITRVSCFAKVSRRISEGLSLGEV